MKYSVFLAVAKEQDGFGEMQKAFIDYSGLKEIILKIQDGELSPGGKAELHAEFKKKLSEDMQRVEAVTAHWLATFSGEAPDASELSARYQKAALLKQYCELNSEGARKISKKLDKRGGGKGEQDRICVELEKLNFGHKREVLDVLSGFEKAMEGQDGHSSADSLEEFRLFDVQGAEETNNSSAIKFVQILLKMTQSASGVKDDSFFKLLGEGTPVDKKPCLYDRILADKPQAVRWIANAMILFFLLYLFLLGLDLMGNAFKAMSGKGVGNLLSSINNPIAGVALGIVVTVLLQSSSTTTSIVVAMVGAGIITVKNAIPIIMGANIGTSITAAIVSHAHITNAEEFYRGFAGAGIHGSFNLLTVLTLLPLEVITQTMSGGDGFLGAMASALSDVFVGVSATEFHSPIKVILSPLSKKFIGIDKDLIKAVAKGCIACHDVDMAEYPHPDFCYDHVTEEDEDGEEIDLDVCITNEDWEEKYLDGQVIKEGFAMDMGDTGGGIFILILSLVMLCLALYGIVKLLHHLVMSSGRAGMESGGESSFVTTTRKVLRYNACVSIIFGMLMTIAVQSSSIVTSALTPVVALGIISVEDMLPLALGANIGTTCTAFLASIVTESKSAITIALCHLFFNLVGIAVWYPIPKMRRVPLVMAQMLGRHALSYTWFGVFYMCFTFIACPFLLFACSFLIELGTGGLIVNIILDVIIVGGAFTTIYKFDHLMEKLSVKKNTEFANANFDGIKEAEPATPYETEPMSATKATVVESV